jgi:hypothetical protein
MLGQRASAKGFDSAMTSANDYFGSGGNRSCLSGFELVGSGVSANGLFCAAGRKILSPHVAPATCPLVSAFKANGGSTGRGFSVS